MLDAVCAYWLISRDGSNADAQVAHASRMPSPIMARFFLCALSMEVSILALPRQKEVLRWADDYESPVLRRANRSIQLPVRVSASQTAVHHFCEDFGGHVTTTPLGVEIFGWCGRDHFIHRFSCCDQILSALSNLYQH